MSDKQVRAQYTREFKQEAVRQVRSGQAIAVVAKVLVSSVVFVPLYLFLIFYAEASLFNMAMVLVAGGVPSVLIAYELAQPVKWERVAALQEHGEVIACVDAPMESKPERRASPCASATDAMAQLATARTACAAARLTALMSPRWRRIRSA